MCSVDLIRACCERQQRMGASDGEFALRLGLSRSAWRAIRRGWRRPGPRALSGILRAFPDLAPAAVAFLRDRDATYVA
jgi:hypothetical protein